MPCVSNVTPIARGGNNFRVAERCKTEANRRWSVQVAHARSPAALGLGVGFRAPRPLVADPSHAGCGCLHLRHARRAARRRRCERAPSQPPFPRYRLGAVMAQGITKRRHVDEPRFATDSRGKLTRLTRASTCGLRLDLGTRGGLLDSASQVHSSATWRPPRQGAVHRRFEFE